MPVRDILIAGGYGAVGRYLSAELARRYPDAVIVTGRDLRKAEACVREIGYGARPMALDVSDHDAVCAALIDVAAVANCVPDHTHHLLRAAVDRGLAYTDITPFLIRRELREIAERARATGARIVGGEGLAPGITSIMARAAADQLETVDTVTAALFFSLGDAFGPASLDFFTAELSAEFEVSIEGAMERVRSFSDPRIVEFPAPIGRRVAYRAPFADQFSYPLTLGARTAGTWLALDPAWLGRMVAAASRLGLGSALENYPFCRRAVRAMIELVRRHLRTSDAFALAVETIGAGVVHRYTLAGHCQAEATAVATALVVRALCDGEIEAPGTWYPEQVLDADVFFSRLAHHGFAVIHGCGSIRTSRDRDSRWNL